MLTTSVTSSGFGRVFPVLVATVFGCPTSPQAAVIQTEEYRWQAPALLLVAEALPISEAELATLYSQAADEDRALAAEGAAAWSAALDELDRGA